MFTSVRLMVVTAALAGLTLIACTPQLSPAAVTLLPVVTPSALATTAAPQVGVVPDALAKIEGEAEHIFDVVPNGDWAAVAKSITTVTAAWQAYQPQAAKAGVTPALEHPFVTAFAQLQKAAGAQDQQAAMQAANNLSAAVVDMFDIYHPAIPADIGRLDMLERQIKLDVTANDYTAADKTFAQIQEIWARVKPSIVEHKGAEAAKQYDDNIAAQAAALKSQDGGKLSTEAQTGLDIVDRLEKVYP